MTQRDASLDILVVDDDRDSADTMVMLLQTMGHRVRVAYDGGDALAQATERIPAVVLLDLTMPDMDGFEVASRLRTIAAGASVHLIALTGWSSAWDRRRTTEAGFAHHLIKPVEPEQLDRLLARLAR